MFDQTGLNKTLFLNGKIKNLLAQCNKFENTNSVNALF